MTDFGWLPEAGAAGAFIAVVVVFLRFLQNDRKAFLDVITNHLKHSDETMQKLTSAVEKLIIIIDERLQ